MTNTLFFLSVLSAFQNPEPKYKKTLSRVLHLDIPVNTPKRQKQNQVIFQKKTSPRIPGYRCFTYAAQQGLEPGQKNNSDFLCREAGSCYLLVLLVWDSASSTPGLPKIETLQNEAKRPAGTRSPARDARAQWNPHLDVFRHGSFNAVCNFQLIWVCLWMGALKGD